MFDWILSFTDTKQVYIPDWKPGLLNRIVQIAIISYIAYDIIYNQQYLLMEIPRGHVRFAANQYVSATNHSFTNHSFTNHSFTNHSFTNHSFTNHSYPANLTFDESFIETDESISFITSVSGSNTTHWIQNVYDNFLTIDSIMSVSTMDVGNQVNVRILYPREPAETYLNIDHTKSVQLSLRDILSISNMTHVPPKRSLHVMLNVEYYNIQNTRSGSYHEPTCVMNFTVRDSAAPIRTDIRFDQNDFKKREIVRIYGIVFTSVVKGSIGRFDFYQFVLNIITGLVLLSTSRTIISVIVFYLMGHTSRIYNRKRIDRISIANEYASFLMKLMLAKLVYDSIDTTEGDGLDMAEVKRKFMPIASQYGIRDTTLECIADDVVSVIDRNRNGKISFKEFVDFFLSDQSVNINHLLRHYRAMNRGNLIDRDLSDQDDPEDP